MGKINQNFTMWKGNYREVNFFIEDISSLDNCSAVWACSLTVETTAIITKSSSLSTQITLSGKMVTVILNPADTSTMSPGNYYHELRLVDASGNPSTPAIGTMELKGVLISGA